MTHSITDSRYDVLIVGAGPAGLTTALAATRAGARVLVLDRHAGTTIFPKATGLRPRTMELMRTWGLEDEVRAGSQDLKVAGAIQSVLTGPVLQEFPIAAAEPEVLARMSPTDFAVAPQDHLEPVLLGQLLELGGEVRFGVRVDDLIQHDDGVTVRAQAAHAADETIEARWVVGADGADSTVRRLAGLDVQFLGDEGAHLSTVFRADLARHITSDRYALHMVIDREDMLVFVPAGTDGRWMFDRPLHPERGETAGEWTHERTVAGIRAAAGVPDLEIEELGSFPWSFAAAVASSIQAGRVFLVGDAAHRTTPRGATGMNTGIADGHNLGWKLGWVARGLAGESLLATYAEERYPVGLHNALASLEAFSPGRSHDLSHDFGVVYASSTIQPQAHAPATEDGAVVGATPGARAPHAWVTHASERRSTIDLFEGRLTLLAGPRGHGWYDAVANLSDVAVQVLVLDQDLVDIDGDVERRYHLGQADAVLVRPDGHVTWRLTTGDLPGLEQALTTTLGGRPAVTV
jgi:2-polyprenyl-6-methoxyphenol hydroxylase-like FAD-dependent oxidoreductase